MHETNEYMQQGDSLSRLIAESSVITDVRSLLGGLNGQWESKEESPMELRLRDIIPRDELERAVARLVDEVLDRTITFSVVDMTGYEPREVAGNHRAVSGRQGYECPECGNIFESKAALGGHRYWKHAVSKHSDKTPEELKEESSKRAHEYQESLKK